MRERPPRDRRSAWIDSGSSRRTRPPGGARAGGLVQTVLLELELAGRLERHAGGRVSLRLKPVRPDLHHRRKLRPADPAQPFFFLERKIAEVTPWRGPVNRRSHYYGVVSSGLGRCSSSVSRSDRRSGAVPADDADRRGGRRPWFRKAILIALSAGDRCLAPALEFASVEDLLAFEVGQPPGAELADRAACQSVDGRNASLYVARGVLDHRGVRATAKSGDPAPDRRAAGAETNSVHLARSSRPRRHAWAVQIGRSRSGLHGLSGRQLSGRPRSSRSMRSN